tara:strand:+ start:1654 stop:2232 length:579 start_codon:yes stop_codon:yes gene_type:complete
MIYITINLMKKKQKLFNKKNKNIFENNLLKTLYQFFITVYFFHSYPTKKYKIKKGISFFFIKSKKEANSKNLTEGYFKNNKFKLERFKNKSRFIGIKNKQEIICSGWIHYGTQSRWNVEEINRDIKLNNQYLLYDFYTSKKFRNLGFYQTLLKIIQNKFQNKKLIIYTTSHNKKSIKAISKSGFTFSYQLKK